MNCINKKNNIIRCLVILFFTILFFNCGKKTKDVKVENLNSEEIKSEVVNETKEKIESGISKSEILRNIETAFEKISYSPLNDGTSRYLGSSSDGGMTIEIIGNKNNVSKATFVYGVTDTNNDITIDNRLLIVNRFLKNTVPEIQDSGVWLENKMTDAAGNIQNGYSSYKDIDYYPKKKVTFKFYKSLGACYVIVLFNS